MPPLTPDQIETLAGQPGLFGGMADKFRRLLRGEVLGDRGQPAAPAESLPAVPELPPPPEEAMPVVPAATRGLRQRPAVRAPLPEGESPTLPSAAAELATGQAATAVLPDFPPEPEPIVLEPASAAPAPTGPPEVTTPIGLAIALEGWTLIEGKQLPRGEGFLGRFKDPSGVEWYGKVTIGSDGAPTILGERVEPEPSAPPTLSPAPAPAPIEASRPTEQYVSREEFDGLIDKMNGAFAAHLAGSLEVNQWRAALSAGATANSKFRQLQPDHLSTTLRLMALHTGNPKYGPLDFQRGIATKLAELMKLKPGGKTNG